jgi:hypothetical protein
MDDAIVVTLPNNRNIHIPRAQLIKLEVNDAPGPLTAARTVNPRVGLYLTMRF